MIDIDFNKVDLAFPKILTKKLNSLKKAINSLIDDGEVKSDATYSSQKIMDLINRFGFSIQVVEELPAKGIKNTIYLVPLKEEVHEYRLLIDNDGSLTFYDIATTPNPDYKVGDIIKPIVDNTESGVANRFVVISSVGPDFCESEEGEGLIGVTGTITWQKDHYYEITDIVELKGAVTGDTLGKAFIFNEYSGTPGSFIGCEKLPGCFFYKQEPSKDIKDEYIWVNSQWEKIGSTRVDLSQYYTKAETDILFDKKVDKPVYDNFHITALGNEGNPSTVSIPDQSSASVVQYSLDNVIWIDMSTSDEITLNEGNSVYIRQKTNSGQSPAKLSITGKISLHGNINDLVDYTNPYLTDLTGRDSVFSEYFSNNVSIIEASDLILPYTILSNRCYNRMFNGCTSLTTAPKLPATTLANYCYSYMFIGCTGLTTAPELPATTLANYCYSYMFSDCTGLTTAPSILPATTLANYCYSYMFNGCTSLTTAPELPATTLANYCYSYMFSGCTGLTTAPSILPATTLAPYCYQYMFIGCTSLTTAPELPATTLAPYCYQYMFGGCTSLTHAPKLPATTLANSCYFSMFQNCSNLNYIKCLATDISATNCTNNWVSGVASTGTFVKHSETTSWTAGEGGIPTNWTVVNHYDDIALENELKTKVSSSTITTIWSGTQQEYNSLQTYSNDTLYIIK